MEQTYLIEAESKKSTFSNEYWTNEIEGKTVTLKVTVMWRWGEFSITITEDQKNKIKNSDTVLISDYDYEFISTEDGCERFVEIQDEENYSENELTKIYSSMYGDVDDEEYEVYDENIMEENGWSLLDTTYEICGGVNFKKVE